MHALALGAVDDLRAFFPRGVFALDRASYRAARRDGVPKKLLPFLVDAQRAHRDYYCFDLATPAPEHAVVVFCLHAVVESWPDLAAWRAWVSRSTG